MRIWKYVLPAAGVALLLGASFAFAQQGPKSASQTHDRQTSTYGMTAYNCPGGASGMYRGMAYKSNMGAMSGQHSGMRAMFQKLQSTINEAKSATDPAKVKSLLNQAGQELSQFMSRMEMMGNGKGMMMHHMGQQQGSMMNKPPTTNNQ